MRPSPDLPPRQSPRKKSTKPDDRGPSRAARSKEHVPAWWEDWRWLSAIALATLTSMFLAINWATGRPADPPESTVVDQPVEVEPAEVALPPLTEENSEKPIAEWVIEQGGSVNVVDATDATFYATAKSHLPDAPLRVTGAWLTDLPNLPVDLTQLTNCLVIRELSLDRTPVTDDTVSQVAKLSSLERLSLEETKITEAATTPIGQLSNLSYLALSAALTDAGVSELRHLGKLQGLRLSGAGITDVGLRLICDSCPQLTHLATDDLSLTDSGVSSLRKLPKLRMLGLIRAPISDDCISSITSISSLTHLLIPGTQITASGTKAIRDKLPGCRVFGGDFDPTRYLAANIILAGGTITVQMADGSVASVTEIDEFPEEAFSVFGIDLHGVKSLRRGSLDSLLSWKGNYLLIKTRSLSLADSTVDPSDINRLPQLVGGLQSLDLSKTRANDSNFDSLKKLYWITDTLRITGTEISNDTFARMRASYRGGCHILMDNEPSTETDRAVAEWVLSVGGRIEVILHMPEGTPIEEAKETPVAINREEQLPDWPFYIRRIDLNDCQKVADDDFARFVPLVKLNHLQFANCNVSDKCLTYMEQIPTLWLLTMFNCKPGFTDEGMKSLAKLNYVAHMHLLFQDISAVGIRNLGTKSSLDSLILSGTRIDDAVIERIVAQFPNMRHLSLERATFTDAGLGQLPSLKGLKILSISSPEITDAGVAEVCKTEQLRSLTVNARQVRNAAFEPLLERESFDALGIGGTSVTHDLLAKLRAKHPEIVFYYDGHDSTLIGFLKRGAKVTGSSTLREIEALIDENQFPAPDFVVDTIDFENAKLPERFSFESLRYIPEVRQVSLKNTGVQVVGFEYLAECRNIETLDLEGTHIEQVHLEQTRRVPSLKLINLKNTGLPKEFVQNLRSQSKGCKILSD